MNYIPGFTNYLQASVPQYANGGAVMGDPRQAAVMPMTQEAAPYDLSGLDLSSLGGLNFSGFGGGRMGGVIQDPNIQYITAPISNKGNPTGRMGGNVFAVTPNQPVRLVDLNTKTVIFEGTGADAAREATRLGQSITDAKGRKASYDIQTADPSGNYTTVANEKRNKSTLGKIGDVAGTALPIITAIATGGMSLPAQIALAAGAGGLGAALKGDNVLKGALLGGATAGIVGGTGLDKAIGGALGSVSKGAAQAGGKAAADVTGDIVVTGLSKALQGAGSALGQEALSQVGKAGLSEVTGYKTPAEKFAQQPTPATLQPPVDMYAGVDPIDVLARRAGSGSPFGASFPIPVSAMLAGTLNSAQPTQQNKTAEDIEAAKNPIVVTGGGLESLTPEEILLALGGVGGLAAATAGNVGSTAANQARTAEDIEAAKNPINVTGMESLTPEEILLALSGAGGLAAATAGSGAPTDPAAAEKAKADAEAKKKLGLEEYLRLAGLASGLIGGAAGGGGSGSSGTYGGAGGTGRLNPIFSAKLPSASGLGVNRTQRPMGDVDWLTYGTRPELSFFDYAARSNPAPVTTPVPGNPAGPIMTEEPRRSDEGRLPPPEPQKLTPTQLASLEKQRLEQYAYLSQFPGPTPEELARNTALYGNNEAAGPIISAEEPRPMMAKGGAFAAKGGGSPKRTEFAVNGAGTGRSDDIPAVLSDGEYVIDAETVALLGDGSNKAGAKKLDELRIKVRKHKGRKLAKGRFSANAKRPEAYLSGGRI